MRWLAALAALATLSPAALAGPGRPTPNHPGAVTGQVSIEEGSASATITLTATVVSSTWLSLSGRSGTRLFVTGDGEGRIDLGTVDSEGHFGHPGHAVERADDRGAFHTADLAADVRFTQGVRGELRVDARHADSAPGLDWRYACGEVPANAYRRARSSDAVGTHSLSDGETACATDLRDHDHVLIELALHVGDETPDGRFEATYVFTAVPEVI